MYSQIYPPKPQNSDFLQLLQNGMLFKDISLSDLKVIYEAGKFEKFNKGAFIFYQDDPATTFSVLVHGVIHLSQITAKGEQVIMHYLSAGDEIGIVALFPDQVFPVTAVAASNCLLFTWSKETLTSLIKQYPQLTLNALQMMTERFVVLQNQFRQLATERVEKRIARAILHIADKTGRPNSEGVLLKPPPSRQQLAEMIGTTLYTVSRTCSQWEKDGIVENSRRWLLIQDIPALKAIVEDPPNGSL